MITKESTVIPDGAKVVDLLIQTDETVKQSFFLQTFLKHQIPLIFVGPTGVGKSAVTNNFLLKMPKESYLANAINFSARTSANQTQDTIMSKLDRYIQFYLVYKEKNIIILNQYFSRRKGVFVPPVGKQCIVFVDDLNMPMKEKYGAQPPIELLRQWIDQGNWYDKKDTTRIELVDVVSSLN